VNLFIDHERLDDIEQVTDDNTIGLVTLSTDEHGETAKFDPHRLREALVVAEEELNLGRSMDLSLVDIDDGHDIPALVIRNGETASRGVILAGRTPGKNDRGDDDE